MKHRPFNLKNNPTQDDDSGLTALLHAWKGLEPHTGFETAVWRRIHAVSAPKSPVLSIFGRLWEWVAPYPAWASAMAAAAGILVGVGLAFSEPALRKSHQADEPLLHSRTLAGSYLTMTTGGPR